MTNRTTKQGLATRALHVQAGAAIPPRGPSGCPSTSPRPTSSGTANTPCAPLRAGVGGGAPLPCLSNPTVAAYEAAVADLEGGVGGPGHPFRPGGLHPSPGGPVQRRGPSGGLPEALRGILSLAKNTFARFGVTHTLVDTDEPDQVEGACTPAMFGRSSRRLVGNPALNVAP